MRPSASTAPNQSLRHGTGQALFELTRVTLRLNCLLREEPGAQRRLEELTLAVFSMGVSHDTDTHAMLADILGDFREYLDALSVKPEFGQVNIPGLKNAWERHIRAHQVKRETSEQAESNEEVPEPPYATAVVADKSFLIEKKPVAISARSSGGTGVSVLSDRQKLILSIASSQSRFQLKEILYHFPALSEKTVRNDLTMLCEAGMLARRGIAPRSYYEFNDGANNAVKAAVTASSLAR